MNFTVIPEYMNFTSTFAHSVSTVAKKKCIHTYMHTCPTRDTYIHQYTHTYIHNAQVSCMIHKSYTRIHTHTHACLHSKLWSLSATSLRTKMRVQKSSRRVPRPGKLRIGSQTAYFLMLADRLHTLISQVAYMLACCITDRDSTTQTRTYIYKPTYAYIHFMSRLLRFLIEADREDSLEAELKALNAINKWVPSRSKQQESKRLCHNKPAAYKHTIHYCCTHTMVA